MGTTKHPPPPKKEKEKHNRWHWTVGKVVHQSRTGLALTEDRLGTKLRIKGVELKIPQVHGVAVASNRQVRVVSTRNLLPTTRTNLTTQASQSQLEFWNRLGERWQLER